jgi:hypothetical protein
MAVEADSGAVDATRRRGPAATAAAEAAARIRPGAGDPVVARVAASRAADSELAVVADSDPEAEVRPGAEADSPAAVVAVADRWCS